MASRLGIGLVLLVSLAALACLVVVWLGATLDYQPEPSQLTDFEAVQDQLEKNPHVRRQQLFVVILAHVQLRTEFPGSTNV